MAQPIKGTNPSPAEGSGAFRAEKPAHPQPLPVSVTPNHNRVLWEELPGILDRLPDSFLGFPAFLSVVQRLKELGKRVLKEIFDFYDRGGNSSGTLSSVSSLVQIGGLCLRDFLERKANFFWGGEDSPYGPSARSQKTQNWTPERWRLAICLTFSHLHCDLNSPL